MATQSIECLSWSYRRSLGCAMTSAPSVRPKRTYPRFYLGAAYPGIYFTYQEVRCMVQLLAGLGYAEIGRALGIATTTASQHGIAMWHKLGLDNSKQLVRLIQGTPIAGQMRAWLEKVGKATAVL